MIATIILVAVFNDATQLTNAYGFAVATVMFTTTVLISLQIRYVKQLPYILGIAFFLFFGFLDGKAINRTLFRCSNIPGLFWGASLKKVPQGAWVPLMIGLILSVFISPTEGTCAHRFQTLAYDILDLGQGTVLFSYSSDNVES